MSRLSIKPRPLLFWIIMTWVFYYVSVAVWSREAMSAYTEMLRNSTPAKVLFGVFLASACWALLDFYKTKRAESRVLVWLWVIAPLGVCICLLGFMLSTVSNKQGKSAVFAGDTVPAFGGGRAMRIESIDSGIKDEVLDLDGESGGIFKYEPKVSISAGGGEYKVSVFPPKKIGSAYYHILDYSQSPGVSLYMDGKLAASKRLALKLLPPGKRVAFMVEPLPYRFTIGIAPKKVIVKGETKAGVYDLRSPEYEVKVEKGESVLYDGPAGEGVAFDGYLMRFSAPEYWVLFEAAIDLGMPVLTLGLIVFAAGLPLMLTAIGVETARKLRAMR